MSEHETSTNVLPQAERTFTPKRPSAEHLLLVLGRLALLLVAFGVVTWSHGILSAHAPLGRGTAWLTLALGVLLGVVAVQPLRMPTGLIWRVPLGVAGLALAALGWWLATGPGRELQVLLAWLSAVLLLLASRFEYPILRATGTEQLERARAAERFLLPMWARILWMLLALAAGVATFWVNAPGRHGWAALLWLFCWGSLILIWLPARNATSQRPAADGRRWLVAALMLCLLIAAGVLRLVGLDSIPAKYDFDEGAQGLSGVVKLGRNITIHHATSNGMTGTDYGGEDERRPFSIMENGFPDLFGSVLWSFPNISYLVPALFFQIGEINMAWQRAGSAVLGWLSVLVMFFAVRRWFGAPAAWMAAIMFCFGAQHIGWSRMGLNAIQCVLVGAFLMWALGRAVHNGRRMDFVLTGIALGSLFHVYHGAKANVVVAAALGLLLIALRPSIVRYRYKEVILCALAFFFTVGPTWDTALFYQGSKHAVSTRYQGDAVWQALLDPQQEQRDQTLHRQLLLPLTSLTVSTPAGAWGHNGPMLTGQTAVLFYLGLGLAMWRWCRLRNLLALIWLVAIIVLGGMMMHMNIGRPHLLVGLPAYVALAALPLWELYQLGKGSGRRWLHGVAVLLIGAALTVDAWQNVRAYWVSESHPVRSDLYSLTGRLVGDLPPQATLFSVGLYHPGEFNPHAAKAGCTVVVKHPVSVINWGDGMNLLPLRTHMHGDVVVMGQLDMAEPIGLIQRYYPTMSEIQWPRQDLMRRHPAHMRAFRISRTDIVARQGWQVDLVSRDDPGQTRTVVQVNQPRSAGRRLPTDLPYPAHGVWRGVLRVPHYGPYRLRLEGPADVAFTVSGHVVPATDGVAQATLRLAAGLHALRAQGLCADADETLQLLWGMGEHAPPQPIPMDHLGAWPDSPGLTLRGFSRHLELTDDAAWRAEPDWRAIDMLPCYHYIRNFANVHLPGPLQSAQASAEWKGTLHIKEGGAYRFLIVSSMRHALWINDQPVVPPTPPRDRDIVRRHGELGHVVTLIPGSHAIRLRVNSGERRPDDVFGIQVHWQTPWKAAWEIMPETVLTPDLDEVVARL